ncbi:hypothetical protein [Sinisalibacter lacisalsi]|uniref:Uncharacterized protein n=1 Tax=Sinisalibacter lacisalsi TaxID=1526570 RepID=A0ABQ1QCH8_9RHOB|nr:hypothetical protein [Sinisalibacter lacisalsi]GGD21739.1 hypothetical protein GCM10011358_02780 [Sinisalibacter lacisalsi]
MFADLKEKLAEFDKKRAYTAVATVVIAGAAGHFMQDSAQEPGKTAPVVTASIPASASVVGPSIRTSDSPAIVETPAPTEAEAPAVVAIAQEPIPAEEPTTIADAAGTDAMAPEPAPAEATEADANPAGEEVTRGDTNPVLDLADEPATAVADSGQSVSEDEEVAPTRFAALNDANEIPTQSAPAPVLEPEASCDLSFSAEPQPAAMVALTFEAPCHSGEDVSIAHGELRFSEQLAPDGSLMILVPAMTEIAVFTARLDDGQNSTTETRVPDFGTFDRFAIVWKGATGLQLHVLENGAFYGEPGHVWAEQPGTSDLAIEGTGGFVSVLGSTADGYAADIYTYPAGLMVDDAGPEISIEAQVMENTCGTQVSGQILRSNTTGAPNVENLSIAVPGCDAVGEYLVLKNLPQELKLARN